MRGLMHGGGCFLLQSQERDQRDRLVPDEARKSQRRSGVIGFAVRLFESGQSRRLAPKKIVA